VQINRHAMGCKEFQFFVHSRIVAVFHEQIDISVAYVNRGKNTQ